MNNNIIFALDIGTRSIVGIVAEKLDDSIKVIAYKSIFHEQRTMVDGQIEDIKKVSQKIGLVKKALEDEVNMTFTEVYIAAAGRSLKTEKVVYEKTLDNKKPIDETSKNMIEMDALQKAHDVFYEKTDSKGSFYCVGYSVLNYSLDNTNIKNIVGHRGEKVSLEIIAAFLPHIVVEGLYACMDNNKLEVKNLTLEPIAAMNLVIPSDLRLLNIALVDIGAGTSDIAVSKDGSIIGYEMATIAGDEITESIMKNHLVDFKTAESIKMSLLSDIDIIEFNDILGMHYSLEKDVIINSIMNASMLLCQEIASKILKLNNEPPVAVFLIGGGSKTANIRKYLSDLLNLPEHRIAIGSENTVKNADISIIEDFGPELITPVGIAYSCILDSNYDFFSVMVNGLKIRLYSIRQMKVMDALLMAGFDSKKLIGLSGKNLSFIFNGKEYFYNGEYSTPATITVNNVIANIETKIFPGDSIEVVPAVNGSSPVVKISDIAEKKATGKIIFNGTEISIGTKYFVNNTEVDDTYIIGNSDAIEIVEVSTLKDLIDLMEIDYNLYIFMCEGIQLYLDDKLENHSSVDAIFKEELKNNKFVQIESNNKMPLENKDDNQINNTESNDYSLHITLNGQRIELNKKDNELPYIFADMLILTDIDPTKPQGKIIIKHNGKDASYTSLINDGDDIIIKWDK